MKIFHEITEENNKLALALGFFDGVHIGHKKILNTLIQQAKMKGIKTAVITFDDNPANYFNKEKIPAIQSFKDKELIMASVGIDYLYELSFEKYKDLNAHD